MAEPTPRRPVSLPLRLGHTHERWTYGVTAVLWGSGALWLLFHYFFQVDGRFGPRPHPLQAWWLRLHGLAMMLALATFGSLFIHHMRRAWQLRRNRLAGGAVAFLGLWLIATGYALYYFANDANAAWLPLLHWIPGLLLPVLLAVHIVAGRRRSQRRSRGRDRPATSAAWAPAPADTQRGASRSACSR